MKNSQEPNSPNSNEHKPNESFSKKEKIKNNSKCENCLCFINDGDEIERYWSSKRVCKKCQKEITDFVMFGHDGNGFKHEESYVIDEKFPNIFKK